MNILSMGESLPCDRRSCRRVHPLDGMNQKLSIKSIKSTLSTPIAPALHQKKPPTRLDWWLDYYKNTGYATSIRCFLYSWSCYQIDLLISIPIRIGIAHRQREVTARLPAEGAHILDVPLAVGRPQHSQIG